MAWIDRRNSRKRNRKEGLVVFVEDTHTLVSLRFINTENTRVFAASLQSSPQVTSSALDAEPGSGRTPAVPAAGRTGTNQSCSSWGTEGEPMLLTCCMPATPEKLG